MSVMGNVGKAAKRRLPTTTGTSSTSLLGNKNNQKKAASKNKKGAANKGAKTGANKNNPLTAGNYTKTVYKDQMTDKSNADKWLQKVINTKWNAQNNANYQQAQNFIGQYANRPDFSYDVNKDTLYQQYKNQYINNAQEAMRDTIARQNAANGGYGTSYGETAAQQQYQKNLEGLNNVIPQLYEAAYQKYQDKGNQLMNSANLYNTMYGLDKDAYDTNLARKQAIQGVYENRRISGAQTLGDLITSNRAFKYQKGRDKVADDQWNKEFKEGQRQFNASLAASNSGGGGGGGSSSGGGGYTSKKTGGTYKGGKGSKGPKITTMTTKVGNYEHRVYVQGGKYYIKDGTNFYQVTKPMQESINTGYWSDVNGVADSFRPNTKTPSGFVKAVVGKARGNVPSAKKIRARAKEMGVNVDNATVAAIQKSIKTGKSVKVSKGKKSKKK